MNIKTIGAGLPLQETKTSSQEPKTVRSEGTQPDRDSQGQQDPRRDDNPEALNEEEVEEILAKIKALPGVVENHLEIKWEVRGKVRFVIIKDLQGQVGRRIPESELSQLLHVQDKKTGQLYDKAG